MTAVEQHVEAFARRVITDAMIAGDRACSLRRAEAFERSRPRTGDFTGQATREDLARRDRDLAAVAEAWRNRAALLGQEPGLVS